MKKELLGLIFITNCFAATWNEVFDAHATTLSRGSILREQCRAYESFQAPVIADQKIKTIPIDENREGLVDLKTISVRRIQMLPDPSVPFESPSCNSGLPSASKMRIGVFVKLELMVEALDDLASDFGYEPGQISIKVFEGLRDLAVQEQLFLKKREEILSANSYLTLEEAEQETAKWVSPIKNNVPVHSTGAAVDIRLWDNQKGDFLDMGSFGVIWGENKTAPTFSEEISSEQKQNRLYCLMAAEKAGLMNYVYEFWHFSSGDRYAAYWEKKDLTERRAIYGSIQ